MRTRLILAAASVAALCVAASPAFATTFVGSYSASYNTADPGLVLATTPINPTYSFNLNSVGSTAYVDLFDIFTNEGSVNLGEDTKSKPITVDLDFTAPGTASGSVSGHTAGIWGIYEAGVLHWNGGGNTSITFTDGAKLGVHLDDVVFGAGGPFGGLTDSTGTVTAKFTELKAAVPEPATWATMLLGVFGIGAVLRMAKKGYGADVRDAFRAAPTV